MKSHKWIGGLLISLSLFSGCLIESSNCNQFNIDSFELITGFDIPKITAVECFENDSIRTSFFYLDVDHPRFIKSYQTVSGYRNRFEMPAGETITNIPFLAPEIIPENLQAPPESMAYLKKGTRRDGRKWQVTLFEESKLLIAEIETK